MRSSFIPTAADGRRWVRAELPIVGLAPGLRGANRTGRPFTGDFAGVLLYETLLKSLPEKDDATRNLSNAIQQIVARRVAHQLASSRGRGTLAVLTDFRRLVRLDHDRHTALVESATPLAHGARTFGMWVPNTDPSGSGLIVNARFRGQEGAPATALRPQSPPIRRMQHEMAERYNLASRSRGRDPFRHVEIFRPGMQ